MREARHELVTAPADAELIELRIDAIADLDIPRLLQRPRKKVIVTNRRKSEGGKYGGSADKQFDILAQSAKLGAEYIDAEFSWGKDFIKKLSKEKGRAKLICSYHDFSSTPANIAEHCKKMCETGADIVKIATTAKDIVDCKRLFDLHQIAQKAKCSLIVVGMGERGQITRILSGKFGGYLTYASEDELSTTAPGQLALEDMKTVYQVHLLDKRTKVFGLIGNPVSQSKGVNFHNSLFQRKSLNSVYVNCLVDNLQTFLPAFRDVF
jgi:3-dehydroquinate dehydratase/shikimate dehydrogenase